MRSQGESRPAWCGGSSRNSNFFALAWFTASALQPLAPSPSQHGHAPAAPAAARGARTLPEETSPRTTRALLCLGLLELLLAMVGWLLLLLAPLAWQEQACVPALPPPLRSKCCMAAGRVGLLLGHTAALQAPSKSFVFEFARWRPPTGLPLSPPSRTSTCGRSSKQQQHSML